MRQAGWTHRLEVAFIADVPPVGYTSYVVHPTWVERIYIQWS